MRDNFDRQDFNKMCWTLCSRKNLDRSKLFISNDDAFKIWCIFNFLSEDRYPLMMVTEEVSQRGPDWLRTRWAEEQQVWAGGLERVCETCRICLLEVDSFRCSVFHS